MQVVDLGVPYLQYNPYLQYDPCVNLLETEQGAGKPLEARRTEVQAALISLLGPEILSRGGSNRVRSAQTQSHQSELQVVPGQYDMLQLAKWRKSMGRVLGLSGVVLTDLDEAKNRLCIGVEPGALFASVEGELAKLGIAREAVLIEEVKPPRVTATLQDRIRPAIGGTMIFGPCTLGFNAIRSGVRGFLTNSHCTGTWGGVEGTVFWQPSRNTGNRIGVERVDPVFIQGGTGGCPTGKRCRWSDAAFVRYDSGVQSSLSRLAWPVSYATGPGVVGSLEFDGNYTITHETPYPFVGEVLDKVGRTTGQTYGVVSATCVDASVANSNIILFCQDFVANAAARSGDSGSPVFRWDDETDPFFDGSVDLYGIVWGGAEDYFVFSAMWNIEKELGALRTY